MKNLHFKRGQSLPYKFTGVKKASYSNLLEYDPYLFRLLNMLECDLGVPDRQQDSKAVDTPLILVQSRPL